ncbi:MAG: LexA family transcriptional regulator [Candidatus Omnitrophota bacterium]|nr:LexA family transcriptional regulator [Candidatus Omnitrophota bacterium]
MTPAITRYKNYQEHLRRFYQTHKRIPSYSEMAALFSFRSKNAVAKLVKKFITHDLLTKNRFGHLTPGRRMAQTKVLGTVQAGFPSPAEEELIDTLSLDEFLIRRPEASYLLKVSGDSMIDAGIHPGDMVIVERGHPVKNGDIVVVQADGEWTMKYYHKKGKDVFLKAANRRYPIFKPRQELVVGGVVVACIRKYVSK